MALFIYILSIIVCYVLVIYSLIKWSEITNHLSDDTVEFVRLAMKALPILALVPVVNTIIALVIIISIFGEHTL